MERASIAQRGHLKKEKVETEQKTLTLESNKKKHIQQFEQSHPQLLRRLRNRIKTHYLNEDARITDILDSNMPLLAFPDIKYSSFMSAVLQLLLRIKVN